MLVLAEGVQEPRNDPGWIRDMVRIHPAHRGIDGVGGFARRRILQDYPAAYPPYAE